MCEQDIIAGFKGIGLNAISPERGLVKVYRWSVDDNDPVFTFRHYKLKGWSCQQSILGISTGQELLFRLTNLRSLEPPQPDQ